MNKVVGVLKVLLLLALLAIVIAVCIAGVGIVWFKNPPKDTSQTLFNADCGDIALTLTLHIEPYAAAGSDVVDYRFYYTNNGTQNLLSVVPLGLDTSSMNVPKLNSMDRELASTASGTQSPVYVYVDPQLISGSGPEFTAIGDCFSSNINGFNTALAGLRSSLPSKDRYDYDQTYHSAVPVLHYLIYGRQN